MDVLGRRGLRQHGGAGGPQRQRGDGCGLGGEHFLGGSEDGVCGRRGWRSCRGHQGFTGINPGSDVDLNFCPVELLLVIVFVIAVAITVVAGDLFTPKVSGTNMSLDGVTGSRHLVAARPGAFEHGPGGAPPFPGDGVVEE